MKDRICIIDFPSLQKQKIVHQEKKCFSPKKRTKSNEINIKYWHPSKKADGSGV
jgi:hypothetical protein